MKIDAEGKYADNHKMFALKFCFEKERSGAQVALYGGKPSLPPIACNISHWNDSSVDPDMF